MKRQNFSRLPGFMSVASASASIELEKYDDLLQEEHTEPTKNSLETPLLRISWYELQKVSLLGQGVYTNVHLVVDVQSKQKYALKCLDPQRISTAQELVDAATDLAREAALLSKLEHHENIIRLRGVSSTSLSQSYQEDGDGFFFLMDVLEETLKDRLTRWRLDAGMYQPNTGRRRLFGASSPKVVELSRMYGRLETVALGIVRGMRYLHEVHSIVLRDLKPANIGFDGASGKVRLIDFGMARPVEECYPDEVAGTPRFMAPEVMLLQGTSFASDVYSFGIVLYEICSLQPAYGKQLKNATDLEAFQKHVAVDQSRPNLDSIPCPVTKALIQECWDNNPRNRPSFAEIERRLVDIAALAENSFDVSTNSQARNFTLLSPSSGNNHSTLYPGLQGIVGNRLKKTSSGLKKKVRRLQRQHSTGVTQRTFSMEADVDRSFSSISAATKEMVGCY